MLGICKLAFAKAEYNKFPEMIIWFPYFMVHYIENKIKVKARFYAITEVRQYYEIMNYAKDNYVKIDYYNKFTLKYPSNFCRVEQVVTSFEAVCSRLRKGGVDIMVFF
ncbi:hypothetical protein MOSE0_J09956 [Monosporozyma servazzii]